MSAKRLHLTQGKKLYYCFHILIYLHSLFSLCLFHFRINHVSYNISLIGTLGLGRLNFMNRYNIWIANGYNSFSTRFPLTPDENALYTPSSGRCNLIYCSMKKRFVRTNQIIDAFTIRNILFIP